MSTFKKELDEKMTSVYDRNGAFFAFSNEQFFASRKEGVDYVSLPHGLVCPKKNVKSLYDELNAIVAENIKIDIEQNGIENIIKRELSNHEAYYTGEIEDTADALKGYGISIEQIREVYGREYANQDL